MSIQEQLIEDMKSMILSEPGNLIKMINEISIENKQFAEYYRDNCDLLIKSLKNKVSDIELHTFCRVNGFTESITDNHLNIGEIILVAERNDEDDEIDYQYIKDLGRYSVTVRTVERKLVDTLYETKTLTNFPLVNITNSIKYQDKTENKYQIYFNTKHLGTDHWMNELTSELYWYTYPEDYPKIFLFRQPKN